MCTILGMQLPSWVCSCHKVDGSEQVSGGGCGHEAVLFSGPDKERSTAHRVAQGATCERSALGAHAWHHWAEADQKR